MADSALIRALMDQQAPDPRGDAESWRNGLGGSLGSSTVDALARVPESSWHDKYVKPWGSAALAQQEPNWFGRILGNLPPEAMFALNFLSRRSAAPPTAPAGPLPQVPKAAAMRFGDEIFTGANHGVAYENALAALGEAKLARFGDNVRGFGPAEGFVAADGQFMTRKQALDALAAHRLVDNAGLPKGKGAALVSEMLPDGAFWMGRRR